MSVTRPSRSTRRGLRTGPPNARPHTRSAPRRWRPARVTGRSSTSVAARAGTCRTSVRTPSPSTAARAMLDLVPGYAPVPRVQARLDALPFRRGALGGAWASKSYVHLSRPEVPLALADLHRALAVGAPADLTLFGGDVDEHDLRRRRPSPDAASRAGPRRCCVTCSSGRGFTVDDLAVEPRSDGIPYLLASVRRERTLPDTVGAGHAPAGVRAEPERLLRRRRGSGFARPGNRYWPAALAAGLVSRDRDTRHALVAPRHRHDRPGQAGHAPGRRADHRRVPRRRRAGRAAGRVAPARRGGHGRPGRLAGRRRPQGRGRRSSPSPSAAARSTSCPAPAA